MPRRRGPCQWLAAALLVLAGCGSQPGVPAGRGAEPSTPPPASRVRSPREEAIYRQAMKTGLELYRQEKYREAVSELNVAVGVHPENAALLRVLGNAHGRANDLGRARRALEASIRLAPLEPGTHYELAQVGLASGDLDLARRESERTLALDPKNARAQESLGTVLYRQGDIAGAVVLLEPAVGRDPERVQGRYILGLCYQAQDRFDAALEAFRAVVERQPEHAEAWFNLGKVEAILGDEEAAARSNARFLSLSPSEGAGAVPGQP